MYFYVCPCTTCISGAHGVQKKQLDPLGMELKMVGSYLVDAGTQTPVFWESNSQCFNHQTISLAP